MHTGMKWRLCEDEGTRCGPVIRRHSPIITCNMGIALYWVSFLEYQKYQSAIANKEAVKRKFRECYNKKAVKSKFRECYNKEAVKRKFRKC